MTREKIDIRKLCLLCLLMFACLFTSLFNLTANFAFADEEISYSGVLEDLQKDENFNADDFPVKEDDYSLKVIQIAESVNKELFVYVYNPSADRLATSI